MAIAARVVGFNRGGIVSSLTHESTPIRVSLASEGLEPRAIPVQLRKPLTVDKIESAIRGDVLDQTLSNLGLRPAVGRKLVRELRKQARADGISLSVEEARVLANLMMLVGSEVSNEVE